MSSEVLKFGDYELDRSRFQLRRNGLVVHLERKPLEMLFLLAERGGKVVSREEILERVWGKQVFIDTDSGINTAIRKARRALNDDVDSPSYLLAVPGKGYRFIGAVRGLATSSSRPRLEMIGRVAEIGQLATGLNSAASEHSSFAMICGEPGIGKSRLAKELAALASQNHFEVLTGYCVDPEESAPLLPFVEILESAVDRTGNSEEVRQALGDEGRELARIVPRISRLITVAPSNASDLPPLESRRLMFKAYRDFIARRAQSRPILLIVEDLHWADESTFALLRFLIRDLSDAAILVVGTYRDSEVDLVPGLKKTLEEFFRGDANLLIRLEGLPRKQVGEMISRLSNSEASREVVDEFFRETSGNPFFVGELFRHLESEGRLYGEKGSFRPKFRIEESDVPRSVRVLVSRRLGRLNKDTREVLALAALAGFSFTLEVLAAAGNPERLSEAIETAEHAGLVISSPDGAGDRFWFSHELVRQAVISEISSSRRLQFHQAIGDSVERVYSGKLEDHFADLANHFRRSGNTRKALEYLDRAAVQAIERTADAQALEFVHLALELINRLPQSADRDRLELSIQLSHCSAIRTLHGISTEGLRAPLHRLIDLAEALGDGISTSYAMDWLRAFHQVKAEIHEARKVARRFVALAKKSKDDLTLARSHAGLAQTLLLSGDLEKARDEFERAIRSRAFDSPPEPSNAWWKTDALVGLAYTLWTLGFPVQAKKMVAAGLRASRPNLFAKAFALHSASWVVAMLGRGGEAQRLAKSSIAISSEQGFPLERSRATMSLARALLASGKAKESLPYVAQGIENYEQTGAVGRPFATATLAECYLRVGDFNAGLKLASTALGKLRAKGGRFIEAELLRLKGELLLAQDSSETRPAEATFRSATKLARAQKAKAWELRATTSLARLLITTNRRREAHAQLKSIIAWFSEGHDSIDLRRATELLDSLG